MAQQTVEILTIGDELCRGEIVNTNATTLAACLRERGYLVRYLTSCRDNVGDMETALRLAASRVDWIITSGGLGPTEDDLTVDVVSRLTDARPIVDEAAVARWRSRTGRELVGPIVRQFRVPHNARSWPNLVGAAPGFDATFLGRRLTCFPGPPREVASVWSALATELPPAASVLRVRVFGLGESQIVARLEDLPRPNGLVIHYRIAFPEVVLSFSGVDKQAIDSFGAEVTTRLLPHAYGTSDTSLPSHVIAVLRRAKIQVASAESCTGGMVGSLLTSVPGASAVYRGGVVAYANDVKTSMLGVDSSVVQAHGAVSEAVARAMAEGARVRFGVDRSVGVTGIAGPDGGSEAKPVGTVWLAVAAASGTTARQIRGIGDRDQIRTIAAWHAMWDLAEGL